MKNGASVSPRADISENGFVSTLVIEGIETDDSGDYSCEALNEAGSMSSTVQIKVRGKILNLHNVLVSFSQWTIRMHKVIRCVEKPQGARQSV